MSGPGNSHRIGEPSGPSLTAFEQVLAIAPGAIQAKREEYEALARQAEDDHRVAPAVREELRQMADALRAVEGDAYDWHPTLRKQNERDFERRDSPAEGYVKETRHDVAKNMDA